TYRHRSFDPKAVKKLKLSPVDDQKAILDALYLLRDDIARREDESNGFVMGNDILIKLVEDRPTTTQQFYQSFRPGQPSQMLMQYIDKILDIITTGGQSYSGSTRVLCGLAAACPGENTRDSTPELVIEISSDVLQELKERITLRKLVKKMYTTEKLCGIPTSIRFVIGEFDYDRVNFPQVIHMKENIGGAGDMKKIEYICVNRTSERLKRLIDYKQQQEGAEQIEYEHD
ncbi:unnamed protein product, partial [Didymodactylos carnosus]